MKRYALTPRPDWREKVEALGLDFYEIDGALYWDEAGCFTFTEQEIDGLEGVANELMGLVREAVAHVIDRRLYADLDIPAAYIPAIEKSWREGAPDIYARFDFAYDGTNPPKMLELNADTPTALFESAVVQWHWLQERFPNADQFNSVHETLVGRWGQIAANWPEGSELHFTCVAPHAEDEATTRYMMATALEAGLKAKFIRLGDIGWTDRDKRFWDLENVAIDRLFKLYPWEWMLADPFGAQLLANPPAMMFNPAWSMVAASKGLLPILWDMFPAHPHLLASFRDLKEIEPYGRFVGKPLRGREGQNIEIRDGTRVIANTGGPMSDDGRVWQEWTPMFEAPTGFAVLGLWMVDGACCGMGVREDKSPITGNASRFVPHLFGKTDILPNPI